MTDEIWNDNWSRWQKDLKPSPFAVKALRQMKMRGTLTLLDAGCGQGRDSLLFAANGINVTALDVSDTALKDVNHPKITPVCADLRDYEPKEASFEAVYANLSLHYFDDATTRRIFKMMHKALTDGGVFFVRCRSVNDPLYGRGKEIAPDMFENPYVRHFFSVDYMRSLLDGFDTVAVREVDEDYYGESVFTEAIAVKGFS